MICGRTVIPVLIMLCCGANVQVYAQQAAPTTRSTISVAQIPKLTDAQLVDIYLHIHNYVPVSDDAVDHATTQPNPPSVYHAFSRLRLELKHRGAAVVPKLLEALEDDELMKQAVPPHTFSGVRSYYRGDLTALLVSIGDPRAVPVLLDRLEPLNHPDQHYERCAIQALTYLSYYTDYSWGSAVERLGAEQDNDQYLKAGYKQFVPFYRNWLATEGSDPTKWLDLAVARARVHLQSDDPMEVIRAATFLTTRVHPGGSLRDDAPEKTLARLVEVSSQVQRGTDGKWTYKDQPVHLDYYVNAIGAYGPAARPYISHVIKLLGNDPPWNKLRAPANIGGTEAIDYLVAHLMELERRIEQQGLAHEPYRLAARNKLPDDRQAQQSLAAEATCRDAIDRWAGRIFETNAQRKAWWIEHRLQDPAQYLKENLPQTAAQADAGEIAARTIFRQAVPDSPWVLVQPEPLLNASMTPSYLYSPEQMPEWKAQAWLEAHLGQLVYDPALHALRLTSE